MGKRFYGNREQTFKLLAAIGLNWSQSESGGILFAPENSLIARGVGPMNRILFSVALLLLVGVAHSQHKPLQVYSIDVEGGQSTLIVSPSGQSLLIDTGWSGFNGRDADRIVAATKTAGVAQLDYVLITHYHRDHVGGVPQLAERMKIGAFIDHGPNQEDSDVTREDYAAYEKVVSGHKHLVVKPGERVPIKGIEVLVLTAAGDHVSKPLHGAGQPNPFCASEPKPAADTTENARSLGILITYGKFRMLDLGDLTKDKELELACPRNLIGTVNLFIVTHHGFDQSNAKALVAAIHPEAAIIDNGAHKGASPEAWQTVHDVVDPPSSGGVRVISDEHLWQLHYATDNPPGNNIGERFIANPDENHDTGYEIKALANPDGTFLVINSRNDARMKYGRTTGK
jgi:competence protein ComEC